MTRLLDVVRCVVFALLVAAAVGVYTRVVGPAIPRHPLESTRHLLIPLTAIAGIVALPVYFALCRQPSRASQVRILYRGFVLTALLYGGYLWATFPDGSPVAPFTALVAAHLLGLPLLAAVVGAHLALVQLGFYPSLRAPNEPA